MEIKESVQLLRKLSEAWGPSSYEQGVKRVILDEVKKIKLEVLHDHLGSLILKKPMQNSQKYRIQVLAHMDEIALMINKINRDGTLNFLPLGGWLTTAMGAQEWTIITAQGPVLAVSGIKPPHTTPLEERDKSLKMSELFLDLGASTYEQVTKLGVRVGDLVLPSTKFQELSVENRVMGKALDNRSCCALLCDMILHEDFSNEVYYTFTTQEEVGARGAKTASYQVNPDIVIGVDVGDSDDYPGGKNSAGLGLGVQVVLYDAGTLPHQGLLQFVLDLAQKSQIPVQKAFISGGRTDTATAHLNKQGAMALNIAIPTRYMHSHTSIIDLNDYANAYKLLKLLLEALDQKTIEDLLNQ
ncbi:MAG: peptidase M28 [Acholeplasmatales bacterium]|jgi:endoglucanase|nr:peptidase M28 [Acholeplasmatales bacterium]